MNRGAGPSRADVWYSGAAVAGLGDVYAWGVTDVTNYSMFHLAWATTTLTSPVKHRQAYYTTGAQDWTRTDVSLAFDPDDLGYYFVSTAHTGYCGWCYCWILDTTSAAGASACDFYISGAAYPTCNGSTLNKTIYQATVLGGCAVLPHPYGSNLTFVGQGSVDPDYGRSRQSYGPPTLEAYYYAGPSSGAVKPQFTIKFEGYTSTRYKERTDSVCQ